MKTLSVSHMLLVLFFSVGLLTAFAQQTSAPSTEKSVPAAPQTERGPQQPNSASVRPSPDVAEQGKPIPPDKVVMKVGDEKVTAGNFYSMMSVTPNDALRVGSQTRRNMGDQYALMLLLAHKAKSERLDSTPDFAQQLALHRTQLLAQMEYKNIIDGIKISPEDISQYYSSHKQDYEEVELWRVYIRKKAEGNAGGPGLSQQEARARAAAVAKELLAGKEMKEVEKEMSDSKTTFFDKNTERALIKQLPAEFRSVVSHLKPGQVSEPIETPQGFSVVQLVGHDYLDLKIASLQIEEQMRKDKMDSLVNELKRNVTVWMDDEYFNYNPSFAPGSATPAASPNGDPATMPPR